MISLCEKADSGWSLRPGPSLQVDQETPGVSGVEEGDAPGQEPSDEVPATIAFDGRTLVLAGRLDIYLASKLQLELLAILQSPPEELVVDLTRLGRIDASIAQLLLAFRREREQATVLAPPEEVRSSLECAGVWCKL